MRVPSPTVSNHALGAIQTNPDIKCTQQTRKPCLENAAKFLNVSQLPEIQRPELAIMTVNYVKINIVDMNMWIAWNVLTGNNTLTMWAVARGRGRTRCEMQE